MSGLEWTQPVAGGTAELRLDGSHIMDYNSDSVKFLDPIQMVSTTSGSVSAADPSYVKLYHNSSSGLLCFKNSAGSEFCLNEVGPQGAQGPQGDTGSQGPIGPQGSVSGGSDFVYAYDTTIQGISSASTFQDVTFNTNATIDGWTHTTSSADFVCPTTATYLLSYRVAITFTAGVSLTTVTGSARLTNNGSEVAGSQSSVQFPIQALSTATAICVGTQQVALTAGDTIRVRAACSSVAADIAANGIGTAPVSAALSIIRLS
jgi:hypothetical protein